MGSKKRLPHAARETARDLRAMGFVPAGRDGTTHILWTHPLAPGAVLQQAGTPRSIGAQRTQCLAKARQLLREAGVDCDDHRRFAEAARDMLKRLKRGDLRPGGGA